MSHNSFGNLLKFTTWGESHGEAIGCVVDGFPAGIPINKKYIQTTTNNTKFTQAITVFPASHTNTILDEHQKVKSNFSKLYRVMIMKLI